MPDETGPHAPEGPHHAHPLTEELGPLYPVAESAAEKLGLGMSLKEAVDLARMEVPGSSDFTPQQVLNGVRKICSAGPHEYIDDPDPTDETRN